MLVVGVTGSLGTGKTTVAKLLKEKGAVVLDADAFSHRALARSSLTHKRIVAAFGRSVLGSNGALSRAKLAERVFGNPRKLERLCRIIHPYVIERILAALSRWSKKRPRSVVVIDAPLLIEAGLHRSVDKIVVVTAPQTVQVKRSCKHLGLSLKAARLRIRAQMPLSKKIRHADFVVDNGGSRDTTRGQVRKLWASLSKLAQ